MKKSIFKDVKTALANAEDPRLAVRVDSLPNGAHLHISTPEGVFIGMVTYIITDNSAESINMMSVAIANWFQTVLEHPHGAPPPAANS